MGAKKRWPERDAWPEELAEAERIRPLTRGQCRRGLRPCPWVSCRYHLAIRSLDPLRIRDPQGMLETCVLDVADRGGATLEEISLIFGLTRERIRQIEERTLKRLSMRAHLLRTYL